MATKLDKDIIRESTILVDGREILITLTSNQEISMKLKGMKSGDVKISILDLFNQLTGGETIEEKPKAKKMVMLDNEDKKGSKKNPMISLYDLRSHSAVTPMDYPTKALFDGIIKNLIDEYYS